jgi:hypothetical protein
MNYGFQKFKLEKSLKKIGVEKDLFDLHSRIDRTLTFGENKSIVLKKAKLLSNKPSFDDIHGRLTSTELFLKAQDQYDSRKPLQQRTDNRIRAKNTFYGDNISSKQYRKWSKNPNQYDIEGVDTQGGFF